MYSLAILIFVSRGHYPVVLKHARVIPIFKAGDVYSACNYQPISTLSILNKIFETSLLKQLSDFQESNKFYLIINLVLGGNLT